VVTEQLIVCGSVHRPHLIQLLSIFHRNLFTVQ
jgi:hypothetical protein